MHPFARKVTLAAILLTLAGVAGASHARADTSIYVQHNWLNGYAAAAIGDFYLAPSRKAIIVTPERRRYGPRGPRHELKHRDDRLLSGPRGHQPAQSQRVRPHASGYSW